MIRYSVNMSCNQGNINYARFILLMHDHADQLSCIRLDSIIPFVVVYKFTFRLFTFSLQGHCNLLHSDHFNNWVSISIFGVRISIQYFCLNFSIKY